ncbi:MAG: hypothetical protein AMXMBFR16_06900 [Candidatus Uhrbacteria bacterium]
MGQRERVTGFEEDYAPPTQLRPTGRGMPRPYILLPTPYFLFRILRTTSYALFASPNPHTA